MSEASDARFWNRMARGYAKSAIADVAGYERTLERTRAHLKATDAVLEFVCGTGTTAIRLAPHVARYVATDIAEGMIAVGREKAAEAGVAVTFEVTTVAGMAGDGSAYDVALGFNILHLIDDRRAALANIARLLKPGGLLITKTVCLKAMNPLLRVAVPLMRAVGQAPFVAILGPDDVARDIEAAGFTIVERGYHGSKKNDPRPFFVAKKTPSAA
jgi:ubiquinone/menaquinone biosynthesis C-methylase UbiE